MRNMRPFAIGLGVAALVSLGLYRGWMRRFARRLARRSHVMRTRRGPVEYADVGRGLPVLVFHGASGGYDQGLLAAVLLSELNLRFIAPSRPGYLRTPLRIGRTPAAQADVFAALLDELGIREVVVLAISAGGPAALQFVLRHRQRSKGLILLNAVSRRNDFSRRLIDFPYRLVLSEPFMNLLPFLVRHMPALTPGVLGVHDPVYRRQLLKDARQFAAFLDFLQCGRLMGQRRAGIRNDVRQMARLPDLALERISVPTLIMHGDADSLVEPLHARDAGRRIPQARLVEAPGGEHLCFITHRPMYLEALRAFLAPFVRAHSQNP